MVARLSGHFSFTHRRGASKPWPEPIAPTVEALEVRRLLSRSPLLVEVESLPSGVKSLPSLSAAGAHGHSTARRPGPNVPSVIPVAEAEPTGTEGQNDTQATAQFLPRFGTGSGDNPAVDIAGSGESFRPVASREDDGSIRRANATGAIAGATTIIVADGRIGDGPHGSDGTGTGDYDHYAVSAQAGQLISVYANAAWLGSTLDTALAIYNSTGTLLASNDDRFDNEFYGFTPDSFLSFWAPASDTYSVVVLGSGSGFQGNPFDSASGGGVGSEGFYRLDIILESPVFISPLEDDGAIPLANDTGLRAGEVGSVIARATIGDGPHGSAGAGTGDFDFYRLEAAAGQWIAVDTDTPVPLEGVDTAVGIYDSAGNLLAFNDDDFETFDSFLFVEAPATDTYFVIVSVFPGLLPADPFDPSSGPGVGSEGDYLVTIGLQALTSDYYSFDLEAGDIIGAALFQGADELNLYGPDGTLLVGTFFDSTSFYKPDASPLPGSFGTTNSSLAYVINSTGRYVMEVSFSFAGYALQLRAFRPVLEQQPVFSHQVLFLDFDGATLTPDDYPAYLGINPNATLSPMSSFLDEFGLAASDESAVIDAIIANVVEDFAEDVSGVVGRGRNGDFQVAGRAGEFQIEILNSRDHADPFGLYPNVSRVIIGGTRQELGFAALGVSATIDVGNFDTSDTAVTMLDSYSDPLHRFSLHRIPRADGATMIDLIGVAVGSTTSHEAGHFFGNWHTDPFTAFTNVMTNAVFQEIGPDGTFGTADDVDVDFGRGNYSQTVFEAIFEGVEDTLNTIAFGLSTGTAAGTYFDFVNGTLYVSGSIDDGRKDELKVRARGGNLEVFINGALADTRPLTSVRHVFFNGSGDGDTLDASGLSLPVTMMGRGGNDELIGGRANDILIGGRGSDELAGGGGDDILIAGHTAFDVNTAALGALLAEWTSPRDYATRVANLSGTGGGPRLNGDHFLKATGPQATVFDDANDDDLTGGAGLDWFFASLSGRRRDEIDDLRSGEVLSRQ